MSDNYLDQLQETVETDLPLRIGCTGYWYVLDDSKIVLQHDGDTCPAHEGDEP